MGATLTLVFDPKQYGMIFAASTVTVPIDVTMAYRERAVRTSKVAADAG